ncbi:MAG: amidohydrolase family protein [Phycisphaeraceae bacterium]|nr:amidohydrolase family protein [Phycisphaeraceae bacterium]
MKGNHRPGRNPDANRFGLDYRAEARRLGPPAVPIIDAHAHIQGDRAAEVWKEAAILYGICEVWSMTPLSQVAEVRQVLGDMVRFIAIHNWHNPDRAYAWRDGFLEDISVFHRQHGARIVKLWAAPRLRELMDPVADADVVNLDGAWRRRVADLAASLGMAIMTHVADPDTWFATRYSDASRFLTKSEHYLPLERMLDDYPVTWIAAHMGGWPENLPALSGLLERHPNLHLDASATKWMVREISRHPRQEVLDFMERWRGRVFFGSDIVTTNDHLRADDKLPSYAGHLAAGHEEAFELYASRYWALRTLWETAYVGESPIADPDLAMLDPARFAPTDAPELAGKALPRDLLATVYAGAARAASIW